MTETTRSKLDGQMSGMRTERYSWWLHWAELARYVLPRRYRWLVTPNQLNRGSPINSAILDSTGTVAARVLAAGMMSGMTSPTRPWFMLRIEDVEDDNHPANIWLAEVRRRMMRVFSESNFYNSIAVNYLDLAVFGTAPMIIYEDFDNVIQCYNPCAGEYYAALDDRLNVSTLSREMVQTSPQLKQWFGLAACSEMVQKNYKQGSSSWTLEFPICHFIMPNWEDSGIAKRFPYVEFYYERGATDPAKFLRKRGFHDKPFICPRWDVVGNDPYGRSPAMDALGDIKQLQQEQKRKAQAIDKLANPPMVADVELKNQPASTVPGGVTYISKKEGAGFKPAYENFRPPIAEMMNDIEQVQARVKNIFFNDLFLMFQQLQAEPRSAAAIDARREEKMVMLGPVLERFQTEALDPVIDRVFGIMYRGGLLPPPPQEAQGSPIKVEYVSMLAAAQKATETTGIERLAAFVGNMAAVHPDALDVIDFDFGIKNYSDLLGNDPRLIKSPEQIAQERAEKQKQQQLQYLTEIGKGAADAAKNLSATDVGGGQNVLSAMLGNTPQ